tara:strand:+ start:1247 stop:1423 length:177 start_codon:yes stop_codon:yes gene_type:complete
MPNLPKRGERTAKAKKAKKLSPAQKKIARVAKPRKAITGADFKGMKKRKATRSTGRRR